jgi:hypothetical protein
MRDIFFGNRIVRLCTCRGGLTLPLLLRQCIAQPTPLDMDANSKQVARRQGSEQYMRRSLVQRFSVRGYGLPILVVIAIVTLVTVFLTVFAVRLRKYESAMKRDGRTARSRAPRTYAPYEVDMHGASSSADAPQTSSVIFEEDDKVKMTRQIQNLQTHSLAEHRRMWRTRLQSNASNPNPNETASKPMLVFSDLSRRATTRKD